MVEEDHHQEEIMVTEEDHTLAHQMVTTEDVEDIQVTEKENIEIEIVNTNKVKEETEIVQDLDKRSIKKEDKADQIHQENDCNKIKLRPDLYNQGIIHSISTFKLFMNQFKNYTNSKIINFNISNINKSKISTI